MLPRSCLKDVGTYCYFKNAPWKFLTCTVSIKENGKETDVHWIIPWITLFEGRKGDKTNRIKCNIQEMFCYPRTQPTDSLICLYLCLGLILPSVFLKNSLAFKDCIHIYKIIFRNFTVVTWHHICTKDKILSTSKILATLKMSLCTLF